MVLVPQALVGAYSLRSFAGNYPLICGRFRCIFDSMNEVTTSSVYQITELPEPIGWKTASLSGAYLGTVLGGGKSLISGITGPALLISEVVQGSVLFDSVPDYVGMPTQNTPLCDVVYFPDLLAIGINAFYKILTVVDDQTMIVEDPTETAGNITWNGAYVLCSRYNPLTYIEINGSALLFGYFLDGSMLNNYNYISDPFPYTLGGSNSPIEPVIFQAAVNNTITATVKR